MILWAILLLVAVWLCAYAGLRQSAFYLFYAVAVIIVPGLLAGVMHLWGTNAAGLSTGAVFLCGAGVAALAYPINHWRLTLER